MPKAKPKRKAVARSSFYQNLLARIVDADTIPVTTQCSIPYIRMYKDGVCHIKKKVYNKTVEYSDANYQLLKEDEQQEISEEYQKFLNYFDSTIKVQMSFLSKYGSRDDFERSVSLEPQGDKLDDIRAEYSQMLQDQLMKGNNGLVKRKFITFSVEAENYRDAKQRLERIETDIIRKYKLIGSYAQSLTGKERLEVLHGQLHPDSQDKFDFNWKDLEHSGLTTKDYIAPASLTFRTKDSYQIGNYHVAASYMQILASGLKDDFLARLLEVDVPSTVNIHITPVETLDALKQVGRQMTDINAMKINEQKKATKEGYDISLIPDSINVSSDEAREMKTDLESRDERKFLVTIVVSVIGKTQKELEEHIHALNAVARQRNCPLKLLEHQQEFGYISSLVLGNNQVNIKRDFTTSSLAGFMPFTTQELFETGTAIYYGLNAKSNNMIRFDRRKLKNRNALIFGKSGSGKSFFIKRELSEAYMLTSDDIMILDPEGEYGRLVEVLGGQHIKLSQGSPHRVNPLDISIDYGADDEDPVAVKTEFMLTLCELILSGKEGLTPTERTIIDTCIRKLCRDYLENPDPSRMPILEDFYNMLVEEGEKGDYEAERLAKALYIYVHGSLNAFNGHTNIDIDNRLICLNIKGLGNQLKKVGMVVVQDAFWSRVAKNRNKNKATWIIIDELHLFLKEEQTAGFTVETWKRFRKWGGMPTGLTQNFKELYSSPQIQNILENTDFIVTLEQSLEDRKLLASQLGLSKDQLSYITRSGEGEGLISYGGVIIPFVDKFPKNTKLYQLMTTKPDEMLAVDEQMNSSEGENEKGEEYHYGERSRAGATGGTDNTDRADDNERTSKAAIQPAYRLNRPKRRAVATAGDTAVGHGQSAGKAGET